jgi:signal transduction histidine kinase
MRIRILFYVLICLNLVSNIAVAQKDTVVLQLKWWNQFQFAGYYAAQLKGIYARAGLQVKIRAGAPNLSPVQEVISGRADYGVTGCDLLLNYVRKEPVITLGVIFQHSPYVMLSTEAKNIHNPGDLAGKKVMLSKDQGMDVLKAVFLREGIPLDSIHAIPHSWNNADLLGEKADAMSAYISVEPYKLKKLGAKPVIIHPETYGIDFYGDLLFTSEAHLSHDADQVERFRKASFEGWTYALSHTDELIDYILTLADVKARNTGRDELVYEAAETQKLILPELIEIGHMNNDRWLHILNTYKDLKQVPANATIDGFVYDPTDKSLYRVVRRSMYVIVIILLLLLLFVLYTNALKKMVKKKTSELQQEILQGREILTLLEASENKLHSKIKELNAYLYRTSHDLRGPLSSISGLISILKAECQDETLMSYILMLEKSNQRMLLILNSLNEITRISQGKSSFEDIHLSELVDEIFSAMKNVPKSKDLDFRMNINLPGTVNSDRFVLNSILQNLIENAIEYRMNKSDSYVSVAASKKNNMLEILVSDNGVGIKPEFHDSVFEMFYRGHTGSEGSGLGLSIVSNGVEKLGGQITLSSVYKEGTSFKLIIPCTFSD